MSTSQRNRTKRLVLNLESAEDLMTSCPTTIRATATVREVIALMVDRGISAVPVVNEAGKAVGVLSQTDIVAHGNKKPYVRPVPEYYQTTDIGSECRELSARLTSENVDTTLVKDVMTPTVFAVRPEDTVTRVVGDMVAFKIHRLFVVDKDGALLGVISAFDVLRKLRAEKD